MLAVTFVDNSKNFSIHPHISTYPNGDSTFFTCLGLTDKNGFPKKIYIEIKINWEEIMGPESVIILHVEK